MSTFIFWDSLDKIRKLFWLTAFDSHSHETTFNLQAFILFLKNHNIIFCTPTSLFYSQLAPTVQLSLWLECFRTTWSVQYNVVERFFKGKDVILDLPFNDFLLARDVVFSPLFIHIPPERPHEFFDQLISEMTAQPNSKE